MCENMLFLSFLFEYSPPLSRRLLMCTPHLPASRPPTAVSTPIVSYYHIAILSVALNYLWGFSSCPAIFRNSAADIFVQPGILIVYNIYSACVQHGKL